MNYILRKEKDYSDELGLYQITYSNGMTQQKELILQQNFERCIKPMEIAASHLITMDMKEKSKELKRFIRSVFPEMYFTTDSPLYHCMKSGRLESDYLTEEQKKVKIVKIKHDKHFLKNG